MEQNKINNFMAMPREELGTADLPKLLLAEAVAFTVSRWPYDLARPRELQRTPEKPLNAPQRKTAPSNMPRNPIREQQQDEKLANLDSLFDASTPGHELMQNRVDRIRACLHPVSRLPDEDEDMGLTFKKQPMIPRGSPEKSGVSRLAEKKRAVFENPAAVFRRGHQMQQRIHVEELGRYRAPRRQQGHGQKPRRQKPTKAVAEEPELELDPETQAKVHRILDEVYVNLTEEPDNAKRVSLFTVSSAGLNTFEDDDSSDDSDDDVGPLLCDPESEDEDEDENGVGRRDSGYDSETSSSSANKEVSAAAAEGDSDDDDDYADSFISLSSWEIPVAEDEEHSGAPLAPSPAPAAPKEPEPEIAATPTNNPHAARFKQLFGAGFDVNNLPNTIEDDEDDLI